MEDSGGNDTRGWIMCIVSGIACVLGASIICVDILVRHIPGKKNFKIEESKSFLAASFALSFGIIVFSALYSILPSAKKYLLKSGYSGAHAAWILLLCFSCGFIAIQVFSLVLNDHLPSHVENCGVSPSCSRLFSRRESKDINGNGNDHHVNRMASESTPLLAPPNETSHGPCSKSSIAKKLPRSSRASQDKYCDITVVAKVNGTDPRPKGSASIERPPNGSASLDVEGTSQNRRVSELAEQRPSVPARRPSMIEVPQRVMSFVLGTKINCDEAGPCFGYTEPCGHTCFRRIGTTFNTRTPTNTRNPTLGSFAFMSNRGHVDDTDDDAGSLNLIREHDPDDIEAQQHHFHVIDPIAKFRTIGLQTSIAIALHKLPEGFITYSTNHANPSLGLSVFFALLVHNVAEGFALALPLYLSYHSRSVAMFWASLLGGISQPLGAGIAAIWFHVQGRDGHQPSLALYGCMFAATSGIMASVALHLFTEALQEHSNRNLCIAFAFIGMAMMGMSNALVSE